MRGKSVFLGVVLCILLGIPLLATSGNPIKDVCTQSTSTYLQSDQEYPTVDGNPLFSLHICIPDESEIAEGIAQTLCDSLHDIGIEGVIHQMPFLWMFRGLYPEVYDVSQYGFVRPCSPGAPEFVTVYEPMGIFQHDAYSGMGVMWCGMDDPSWPSSPGYGNDWDCSMTKEFTIDTGYSMSYSIQYDTEFDWDFVYVQVSLDGGMTWEVLKSYSGMSDANGDNAPDFIEDQVDLSIYAGETVQLGFHFISDFGVSNEEGYDFDGACRIDWVEVTDHVRDEFTYDEDGWTLDSEVRDVTIMQGYDIAFYGLGFYGYECWMGFSRDHSQMPYSQGYSNLQLDALYDELSALPIDWNTPYDDPPDLSNPEGQRALEIIEDLQNIYAVDQPQLIYNNRRDDYSVFPVSPMNHNNLHLEKTPVRQAISLALNRTAVIEIYRQGGYNLEITPVRTWIPEWFPGFLEISYPEYDILAARQLLYDAGYTNVIVPGSVIDAVDSFVDSGILRHGVGNGLIVKIYAAVDYIALGDYQDAIDTLNAFINQVNALITSTQLTESEGQYLITLAQNLIDLLV